MTFVVRAKPGVQFSTIAPGGFRMLSAIERAARKLGQELTVTSACDGPHSGPGDPHHRGEAYDIRTHGLQETQKDELLAAVMNELRLDDDLPAVPVPDVPRGLATSRFFGFIEQPGTSDEHLHVQVRKGQVYP